MPEDFAMFGPEYALGKTYYVRACNLCGAIISDCQKHRAFHDSLVQRVDSIDPGGTIRLGESVPRPNTGDTSGFGFHVPSWEYMTVCPKCGRGLPSAECQCYPRGEWRLVR